jgi:signal transduction histidine kinase
VAIENASLVESLRDADRRKDEFLATLAHELRNPLAPIRTGLEILKLKADDQVLVESIRSTMEGQTRQLVRLVDDLLDISRITSGKVTLRKENVELSTIVDSAVEASQTVMDDAAHQLTVNLPSEPVFLYGDPTRLVQILSNLLTNAARYTERGGRISLTAVSEDDHVVFIVSDSGIGIPAEMLEKIFDMFTQVNQSLERSHGGLGIGLTLVKRLVALHGGTVIARSEGTGTGSEFIIRLPQYQNSR